MERHQGTAANSDIKNRSVQIFIRRVNITFTALLLIGAITMFFFVYLPLNKALEASLVDNFSQVSHVNYHSLHDSIQRGLEGARSLSSRTMIKTAIEEYNDKHISMDELKAYTQPKYKDGAAALEYLIIAERFVDNVIIASYAPSKDKAAAGFIDSLSDKDSNWGSKIYLSGDRSYLAIKSPISSEKGEIAYDELVFDLTERIQLLCTDTIRTGLLTDEEYRSMISNARRIDDYGEMQIFYTEGFYFAAVRLQDDILMISRQSRGTLLAPIYLLSMRILAVGIIALLAFALAIYIYIIRYAKRELANLDTYHTALEKVTKEVNIDPLTKAWNRKHGVEFLVEAFADFQAKGISPAIIMFDIDKFKNINDGYGHYAGDQVLMAVVDVVQSNIRKDDKLFRWGGDEFVGVFYGIAKEKELHFADKILNAVSALKIDTENGVICPTVSMGITYFQKGDKEYSDALARADQAMYTSKSDGRNRVTAL